MTTGIAETKIPRRLDRLPFSKWHWYVVASLGVVWILDGFEVTMKGAVGAQLQESLGFSTVQVGGLASIYLFGAISGALVWGFLTDRFGRRKLFMITLSVYGIGVVATSLTGLAGLAPYIWFSCARFVTGFGIGGEYAAINSAIDEFMPARVRGHIALGINGSWWIGTAIAAALAVGLLAIFPSYLGWRVAFGLGVLMAVGVLLLRWYVPESPRWLITHGYQDEAERVMRQIEQSIAESTGEELPDPPDEPMRLRMRRSTGFLEIGRTVFALYPSRSVVSFVMFVTQAFLYNAIFFTYGLMLTTYFGVSATVVGLYLIPFAAGNFLGPLLLGYYFDVWGRKFMIPATFSIAGILTAITGWLFFQGYIGSAIWMTLAWVVIFFFASAAASSAYLTVSETYPMEIRAMVIAFFYAIGTAAGGIVGPILFGFLIASGARFNVFIGYCVGAGLMIIGGLVHRFLGVEAGQMSLEDVTAPLNLEEAREQQQDRGGEPATTPTRETRPHEGEERAASSRTGWSGIPPVTDIPQEDVARGEEADIIARALVRDGAASREQLAQRVASRYWGPGRYREALRLAEAEGRIATVRRGRYVATQQEKERQERERQEQQSEGEPR